MLSQGRQWWHGTSTSWWSARTPTTIHLCQRLGPEGTQTPSGELSQEEQKLNNLLAKKYSEVH